MSDSAIILLGRILLAVIFIFSGLGKLADIGGTAGYFGSLGLPVPVLTAWFVGLVELLGGIAVAVGFKTKIAAFVLAVFTVAATLIAHTNLADQMQLIMFLKNVAIIGGLLVLASRGASSLSLDGRKA